MVATALSQAPLERRRRHTLPFERAGLGSESGEAGVGQSTARSGAERGYVRERYYESVETMLRRIVRVAAPSEGGLPHVGQDVILQAFGIFKDVMPADPRYVPQVVSTVTGGLQLEWHRDGFDLEIEVMSTGEAVVDYSTVDESEVWDGDYADLRSRIAEILRRAAARH